MNVWIFNHYAQPNTRPGGTRHFDLARELSVQGHEVTIIAAGFHYTLLEEQYRYDRNGFHVEMIEGVRFIWVKTYPYARNDWRRMLNIISYGWRVYRKFGRLDVDTPDIVLGSTVHPFAALAASAIARRFSVPFIFEIRDLWPQTFIDMGLWKPGGWQSRLFFKIEARTVASAEGFVVLSPLTIAYLSEHYAVPEEKILLLPNGVSPAFLRQPRVSEDGRFRITYVGGIDKVHGLDFLLDVAAALRHAGHIRFDIFGDGKERGRLQKRCAGEGIQNVIWHGPVPKSEVPDHLEAADALFVSTSNVLYGSENKLYEYMASATPLVVAAYGGHNNPAEEVGCGISIDRRDASSAATAIIALSERPEAERLAMGERGRRFVEKERMVSQLAARLYAFFKHFSGLAHGGASRH